MAVRYLPNSPEYWGLVLETALSLKTDGCSGPARLTQWFKAACYEHDVHYRTGTDVFGNSISRLDADDTFSWRIVQIGRAELSWNPLTWKYIFAPVVASWRWVAVRVGGPSSWRGKKVDSRPLSGPHARDYDQAP